MLFLLLTCFNVVHSQAKARDADTALVQGSLQELKDARYVLLLVKRSSTLDARNTGQAIIAEAFKTEAKGTRRYRYAYNIIARRINDYIRKYHGLSAVERADDADFIIFFDLLEYRRSLDSFYPYGEIYVIANNNRAAPSESAPRIVWRSKKILWAEDAIKDFIKDFKHVRGE